MERRKKKKTEGDNLRKCGGGGGRGKRGKGWRDTLKERERVEESRETISK